MLRFKTFITLGIVSIGVPSFAVDSSVKNEINYKRPFLVVSGLSKNQGRVIVSVFDNEKDYLSIPFWTNTFSVSHDFIEVDLSGLPKKPLSISVIYDLNSNGELDTNWMGIPSEPVGFPNDAKGFMGPPSFDSTLVDLSEVDVVTVNVKEID